MRISDWSSDVCFPILRRIIGRALSRLTISVWHNRKPLEMLGCKPDRHLALQAVAKRRKRQAAAERGEITKHKRRMEAARNVADRLREDTGKARSEEHTSELQSLMSNSYAAFCLK